MKLWCGLSELYMGLQRNPRVSLLPTTSPSQAAWLLLAGSALSVLGFLQMPGGLGLREGNAALKSQDDVCQGRVTYVKGFLELSYRLVSWFACPFLW